LTQVDERETTSLTACVAHVLGVNPSEVPGDGGVGLRQWLARRNLGLVPVAAPEGFAWPGRFLGRQRGSRTWAVMFGVPPGVVFDPEPGAAPDALDAAFVLAPHDPRRTTDNEQSSHATKVGVVELVAVAADAEGRMKTVPSAEALAGRGLRGDRYARGAGTFSDPSGRGYDLTLVEAEALEELAARGVDLAPAEARRNLVVRGVALDGLIGKRFRVGEVECFGQRRCEPCAHLERLTLPGVLRGLVHRGGLRADVLSDGEIRVGDGVEALP
jgi:MOSC domain-containing protein YiiM